MILKTKVFTEIYQSNVCLKGLHAKKGYIISMLLFFF